MSIQPFTEEERKLIRVYCRIMSESNECQQLRHETGCFEDLSEEMVTELTEKMIKTVYKIMERYPHVALPEGASRVDYWLGTFMLHFMNIKV